MEVFTLYGHYSRVCNRCRVRLAVAKTLVVSIRHLKMKPNKLRGANSRCAGRFGGFGFYPATRVGGGFLPAAVAEIER
jgi:uncharacterized membrane protein